MHSTTLERAGKHSGFTRLVGHFAAALLLGSGFAGSARAQETDAHALLEQMSAAIHSLDYQGSFLYQHAGQVDTLRVIHAGGTRERERLLSLNGPRTEVIRNGPDVTFIQQDGSAIIYPSNSGRGLLPLVPGTAGRPFDENYQLKIVGTDRVAGYATDVIDVEPRDNWRYGYRLWLDRNSRLLLRSIVMDDSRQPLEQFMFVALQIGQLTDETELVPSQRELLTTRAARSDDWLLQKNSAWSATDLPPGFALGSVRQSQRDGAGVEHLVYSDGLANISVYLEPSQTESAENTTLNERGPLNMLTVNALGWRITAVGDVPARTLSAIAGSLRRIDVAEPANRK